MITEKDKHLAVIQNTALEIGARLNILIKDYNNVETLQVFKELDSLIARLRDTKRSILYLRNVEGQIGSV